MEEATLEAEEIERELAGSIAAAEAADAAAAEAAAEKRGERDRMRAVARDAAARAAAAADDALVSQASGATGNDDGEWAELIDVVHRVQRGGSGMTSVLANGLTWTMLYERRLPGRSRRGDIYVTDPRDGEVIRWIVGLRRKLGLAAPPPSREIEVGDDAERAGSVRTLLTRQRASRPRPKADAAKLAAKKRDEAVKEAKDAMAAASMARRLVDTASEYSFCGVVIEVRRCLEQCCCK